MRKPYQLAGLASFFLAVAINLTLAQTSTTTTPPPQAPAQIAVLGIGMKCVLATSR